MVKNVGTVDKIVRVIAGILALVGVFLVSGTVLKVILGILAILMFFTAITGYCALYRVLGISTCPMGGKK
ncbi:MAG: YgaP family membrane protein [Candidatus Caldipriscus sp.]